MKRGRPASSRTAIPKRTSRFYGDPNHIAAQIAAKWARTSCRSGGRWKQISHKEAVQLAIEEFEAHWLISEDGKPSKKPDFKQVLELLRRGRTTLGVDLQDMASKFKW
jgi:hypothetical protein